MRIDTAFRSRRRQVEQDRRAFIFYQKLHDAIEADARRRGPQNISLPVMMFLQATEQAEIEQRAV